MLNYILQNKEWIFSGIGVFIISLFFIKNSIKKNMSQKSGSKSTNIQAGENITLNIENKNDGHQ